MYINYAIALIIPLLTTRVFTLLSIHIYNIALPTPTSNHNNHAMPII